MALKYRYIDKNHLPLEIGDYVEAKTCIGSYGQTRIVRGTLKKIDEYSGITVALEETRDFTEYNKFVSKCYKNGDDYYICDAFGYDFNLQAMIGYNKHEDFEHGHEKYCMKVERPASPSVAK